MGVFNTQVGFTAFFYSVESIWLFYLKLHHNPLTDKSKYNIGVSKYICTFLSLDLMGYGYTFQLQIYTQNPRTSNVRDAYTFTVRVLRTLNTAVMLWNAVSV